MHTILYSKYSKIIYYQLCFLKLNPKSKGYKFNNILFNKQLLNTYLQNFAKKILIGGFPYKLINS